MTLGILAIGIIWFFANVTRTDQHNYNLLKETVEAAMYDAIDLSLYRDSGTIKMKEEIFVGNFLRRFAENADLSNEYVIEIYDVTEVPPKVSLKVSSKSSTTSTGELITFDVVNRIDAILEGKYESEKSKSVSDLCILVRDNGGNISKPELGDYYLCRVNKTRWEFFFVLNIIGNNVNLITDRNIGDPVFMKSRDSMFNKVTNGWTVNVRLPVLKDFNSYGSGINKNPTNREGYTYKFTGEEKWLYTNLDLSNNIISPIVESNLSGIKIIGDSINVEKRWDDLENFEEIEDYISNMEFPEQVNNDRKVAYWLEGQTTIVVDVEKINEDGWCMYPFEPIDPYDHYKDGKSLYVYKEGNSIPTFLANGQVWLGPDGKDIPDCGIRPVITLLNDL